jgi:selenide,water dikinase
MKLFPQMNSAGLSRRALASDRLVLAGGGHTHVLLLKHWIMHPSQRPSQDITLVSESTASIYSGRVPAHLALADSDDDISIDIYKLTAEAKIAFIQAKITGIDTAGSLHLQQRPSIDFDLLSINVGSVTPVQTYRKAQPIKPLAAALCSIEKQDQLINCSIPFHIVGAGHSAVEVAFALRRRWPSRPISLHISNHKLNKIFAKSLTADRIEIRRDPAPDVENTLLCTGSKAPEWLKESRLICDKRGRVLTDATLMANGQSHIFAAGDCAVISSAPRPPSGVWAVQAAKILACNLSRKSRGEKAKHWRPQKRALQLIGKPGEGGSGSAWMQWGPVCLGPHPLLWRWKRRLDTRFSKKFSRLKLMDGDSMPCRGCAAKLPAESLKQALRTSGMLQHAHQPEDANPLAITTYRSTLLASVDGFPALVSDPWLNAKITTYHACSDLWACGAHVRQVQAVLTLPKVKEDIQISLMRQVLEGMKSALTEQHAHLIGGHTIEAREAATIPYSMDIQLILSVSGETENNCPAWRKGPIHPGDHIMISRSIGTGILFAAAMQGMAKAKHIQTVLEQLGKSQYHLANQLIQIGKQNKGCIHAATDVTGFGLIGHLNEMLNASPGIHIELWMDKIPVLPGTKELFSMGIESSLAPSNRGALASLNKNVFIKPHQEASLLASTKITDGILADPQTCGPLLVSCDEKTSQKLETQGWTTIGQAKTGN